MGYTFSQLQDMLEEKYQESINRRNSKACDKLLELLKIFHPEKDPAKK